MATAVVAQQAPAPLVWACAGCESAGNAARKTGPRVTHGYCDLHLELAYLGARIGIWRQRGRDEGGAPRAVAGGGSDTTTARPALCGAAA